MCGMHSLHKAPLCSYKLPQYLYNHNKLIWTPMNWLKLYKCPCPGIYAWIQRITISLPGSGSIPDQSIAPYKLFIRVEKLRNRSTEMHIIICLSTNPRIKLSWVNSTVFILTISFTSYTFDISVRYILMGLICDWISSEERVMLILIVSATVLLLINRCLPW